MEECHLNIQKTCLWSELYFLLLLHLCRIKSSLGGNHIVGMKQKYISTIIFTSKLENVNRHLTKENAYIHFAVSLLNSKHRQNNLCQVSDSKQSVTMRESIPSQPNTALSLSLSRSHILNSNQMITNMVHLWLAGMR